MASQRLIDMEKAKLLKRQCPEVKARTHGESLSTKSCVLGSLNTPVLDSKDDRSPIILKGKWSRSICKKQGKGMSDVPTSVYNVRDIRNSGWPTGGDAYGHGVVRRLTA